MSKYLPSRKTLNQKNKDTDINAAQITRVLIVFLRIVNYYHDKKYTESTNWKTGKGQIQAEYPCLNGICGDSGFYGDDLLVFTQCQIVLHSLVRMLFLNL